MDKMSRKKALNTVFTVLFIGIILTFSIIFLTTALFSSKSTISDKYFDGSEPRDNVFSLFDNACLRNEKFYEVINRFEYRVFNHIPASDVVSGKNGFLFNADTNEYGYSYLDDYSGNIKLSEDQLDRFHKYIEMRSRAYENFGSEYVLAVIPNAQSVYDEYMPSYLGAISENTVLSQVSRYLEAQGFDKFIDLRAAMEEGCELGQLYNNTENSINARGAYVAYLEIVDHIRSLHKNEVKYLNRDYFDVQTRVTDGKTLAKKVGLSTLIKNKTVFISDSNVHIYSLVELFGGLETTYVNYDQIKSASKLTVMLECASEWDKVQLMPYFSSTFSRASYRVGHIYSKSAVANSIPDIVVQVIREDELSSILDIDVMMSYDAGLEPGQNPYTTKKATDLTYSTIGEGTYCITGTVEIGAEVTIFGDIVETVSANELGGRFFKIVNVNDPSAENQICVSVKSEGKTVSDIAYIVISPDDDYVGRRPVYIGDNSMLYESNYNVSQLPDDAAIENFTKSVQRYFLGIKQKNNDADSKMIFALIPEKISVYKDGLSDALKIDSTELLVKRMSLQRAILGSGVAFIDGAESMSEDESGYKLFYQTLDKITDVGSYYIYRDVIAKISRDYTNVNPNPLESYSIKRQRIGMGTLATLLGFQNHSVNEIADRITVSGDFRTIYETEDKDESKAYYTYKMDYSLPNAVVIRSGDCDKVIELMAEHFRQMYVLPEGETQIPDYILQNGVDYVIVLASEMDIKIG